MTEKNDGNNKSEIKWEEDTEKRTSSNSTGGVCSITVSLQNHTVKWPQTEETEKQIKNYNIKQNVKYIINNKNMKTTKHIPIWA